MKKTTSQRDERDELMAELAASMPTDRVGLLDLARAAVDELHAGVMACDDAAVERATSGPVPGAKWSAFTITLSREKSARKSSLPRSATTRAKYGRMTTGRPGIASIGTAGK